MRLCSPSLGFEGTCEQTVTADPDTVEFKVRANVCGDPTAVDEKSVEVEKPPPDIDPGGFPPLFDKPTDEPESCGGSAQTGDPIRLTNGNTRYTDQMPLPSSPLWSAALTYDTLNEEMGVLGLGWFSAFDSTIEIDSESTEHRYRVVVDSNESIYFSESLAQTWPGTGPRGNLSQVTMEDVDYYRYAEPSARVHRYFRVEDGRLSRVEMPAQQEAVIVEYHPTTGAPTSVSDERETWSWEIDPDPVDPNRVGSISTAAANWTFDYAGDLLTDISVDGNAWRAFEYDSASRLIEAADGEGALVATYGYHPITDMPISSQTADEHITDIEYNAPSSELPRPLNRDADEYAARVTWTSGRIATYFIRPVGEAPHRVAEINGDCGCPGGGDFTAFARDTQGRVVRKQDALGYITTWTYDSENRVQREERGHWRADCNPADYPDDPTECRLSPDELATTGLAPGGPMEATDYTYDTTWPNRPATVCTESVVEERQQACDVFTYDSQTGAVLSSGRDGFVWDHGTDTAQQESRAMSNALYSGSEGAVFDPNDYHSGIEFQPGWASEPQPGGLVKETDGPLGNGGSNPDITQFVYYPDVAPASLRGRLAARKDPAGDPQDASDDLVTVFDDYDSFGDATRVFDPRGVVTELDYDKLGRLAETTLRPNCDPDFGFDQDPLCNTDITTTHSYYGTTNRLQSVLQPSGAMSINEYDFQWARLTGSARGPGLLQREGIYYTRAPDTGAVLEESLVESSGGPWIPRGLTEYEYDAAGRLEQVIRPKYSTDPNPGIEEYEYDPLGQVVSFKDPNHDEANVRYLYDPIGRLIEVQQIAEVVEGKPRWIATTYKYDSQGNLTTVTDANGNITGYSVDDFGDTYSIASPVTGTTDLTFDEAGRLVNRVDARGARETRVYDSSGSLSQATFELAGHTNEVVEYSYDYGYRTSATAGTVAETWTYDRRGLVLTSTRDDESLLFGYNSDGSLSSRRRGECEVVEYELDWAGRPAAITFTPPDCSTKKDLAVDVTYLPFGPPSRIQRTGRIDETLTHDWRYRLTQQIASDAGTVFLNRTYHYDLASNLTGVIDNLNPSHNRGYVYDALSRLAEGEGPFGQYDTVEYKSDDIGTRYSRSLFGEDATGQVSLEESYGIEAPTPILRYINVSINGGPWTQYPVNNDAVGNVITDERTDQSYGPRNTLQEISSETDALGFTYDADGRQVASNGSERYLLPGGQPYFEAEGGSSVSRIYLGDRLLAFVPLTGDTPGHERHVFSDNVGFPFGTGWINPMAPIGQIEYWEAESLPFGEVVNAYTEDDPLLRYPGQWQLWEDTGSLTNLFQNGYRWYNPGWGRYTQGDPIGLEGGQNWFLYAFANPLRIVDPLGLYGTNDCSYYDRRCRESGGRYYCEVAPYFCDWFAKYPDPNPSTDDDYEGWHRCVRKCLQDCDNEYWRRRRECLDPYPFGPNSPDPDFDSFWERAHRSCHVLCYSACALLEPPVPPGWRSGP